MGEKKEQQTHIPTRLNILFFIVFLFFAIIILRLAFVQLVEGEQYKHDLEKYSTRELPIAAPRGRILDANGEVIVSNKPVYTVTYVQDQNKNVNEEYVADKLAGILQGNEEKIGTDKELLKKALDLHATLPIAFDDKATNDLIAKLTPFLRKLPKAEQVNTLSDADLVKTSVMLGRPAKYTLDGTAQEKIKSNLKALLKTSQSTLDLKDVEDDELLKYAVQYNISFPLVLDGKTRDDLKKELKAELLALPEPERLKTRSDMDLLKYAAMFDVDVPLPLTNEQRQFQWRKMAILKEMRGYGTPSYIPRRVRVNISDKEMFKIEERRTELPGISVILEPIRQIHKDPDGTPFATHVLGYIKPINDSNLAKYTALGYNLSDRVGVTGLEDYYERQLKGKDGIMEIQVNKDSQTVEKNLKRAPQPGDDLVLAMDWRFQSKVEEALKETVERIKKDPSYPKSATEAHAVVMDVRTGDVLAMASYPDYDLNLQYDQKALTENYDKVIRNNEENKLIRGAYPPGSTAKPLGIMLALQEGLIGPNDTIYDPGYYIVGKNTKKYNWRLSGHGAVNARRTLQVSNNTYMYAMAMKLADVGYSKYGRSGYKQMFSVVDYYNAQFGLGVKTGVDLPGEKSGWFSPYQEIGNLADAFIGQYNSFTPMQLAQYCATIANGGLRLRPHLVKEVRKGTVDPKQLGPVLSVNEPEVLNRVDIDPKWIKLVQEGMHMATQGDGTASRTFRDLPFQVAAKTGTAQTGTGADNALIMAYAPYDNPKIAVAVVVPKSLKDGFHSTDASGPIARKILESYDEIYGMNATSQADQKGK